MSPNTRIPPRWSLIELFGRLAGIILCFLYPMCRFVLSPIPGALPGLHHLKAMAMAHGTPPGGVRSVAKAMAMAMATLCPRVLLPRLASVSSSVCWSRCVARGLLEGLDREPHGKQQLPDLQHAHQGLFLESDVGSTHMGSAGGSTSTNMHFL